MAIDIDKQLARLGLNKKQVETYLYILKNRRVNLKTLADKFGITTAGVSKLLKDMMERGFVKSLEVGNKKVFMATDIREFRDNFLKQKKEEFDDFEQLFNDLEAGYGGFSIKVNRPDIDSLVKTTQKTLEGASTVYEFLDASDIVNIPTVLPDHLKQKELLSIYNAPKDGQKLPWGKSIIVDNNKNYATVLSIRDSVFFTTSNKETIVLNNADIANSIQVLIEQLYKKI